MADDELRPWSRGTPQKLLQTRVFSVHQVASRSTTQPGKGGDFVYLDAGDWVQVVALTDADELVMVEQYRHGLDCVTLEIPGGMVDPGEGIVAAGLRELREETGFHGEGAVIGKSSPNPAILNNWCHTLLVPRARRVGAPEPEGSEELRVRLIPRADLDGLVREGTIHHALVLAGLLFARLHP